MIAICLGGARSVWDDLERARRLVGDAETITIACNFAGITYPGRLDAWATLHPEMFEDWKAQRAELGFNTDYRAIIHKAKRGVRGEVVPHGWYGSSGLYMAQVALEALGADGVILCGVPMEAEGQHIHWPGEWADADKYRGGFLQAKADGANIRSMGGWTAEVLGKPDAEWLDWQGIEPPADIDTILNPEPRSEAMRVKFLKDRNWTHPDDRRQSTKYKAGMELTIKRAWGEAMVADGVCEEVNVPPRKAD